jgi:Rrf2 family transcriptional repressor of oqxAB
MIDVRFPTTLQLMLSLALAAQEGEVQLSSAQLAAGAGTSPTLVRRLLPQLARAGLVTGARGRDGGVRLARPAGEITLRAVYEATFSGEPMWKAREDVPHRCLVSNNICAFFSSLTREAEEAMLESLERRTLADSLNELRSLDAGASGWQPAS